MTVVRDCITLRFKMICDDCKTRLDGIGDESREDCHKRAQREGWYYTCSIGREIARCPQCIARLDAMGQEDDHE